MDNQTPEFTPEQVDEQLDQLLARRLPASQPAQVINDLQQMYQDDERSFWNVWQRLGLEQQPEELSIAYATQEPARADALELERNHRMSQTHKHSLPRAFSLIAAACIAALIVGGMLILFHLGRPNGSHTATPGTSQNLYASDSTSVFKLDARTHQVLWQQKLSGVTKIIPSGQVVYVLQSTEHGDANAVLELDAGSGQTLWTYAFPAQARNNVTRTVGMLLVRDQLYIGWQIVTGTPANGSYKLTGQIYVLKASDGSKLLTYPVANGVWSMDADAGVLAISAEDSLQVYNLTTGKSLWHLVFQASTNVPVISLKIVNGLIYAVVIAHNETGPDFSSLRVYSVTTGQQVWQSPAFATDELISFAVDQHTVYLDLMLDSQPFQKKPVTGRVSAYNIQSNKQLWSVPVAGATFNSPVLENGVLYMGIDSGVVDNIAPSPARIVALDATTGTIKWQQTLSGDYIAGFSVDNGVIYANTFSTSGAQTVKVKLYAIQVPGGKTLWEDGQYGFYVIVPGA